MTPLRCPAIRRVRQRRCVSRLLAVACHLVFLAGANGAWGQEHSAGSRELSLSLDAGQTYPQGHRGFVEFVSSSIQTGRFVSRRVELLLDGDFMVLRQPAGRGSAVRETAKAASLGAGLRWYPAPSSWRVEPFAEIVEGLFYADRSVPAPGTRYNFLTRIGGGVQLPPGRALRLFVKYRWVHISNANIRLPNPGVSFNDISAGIGVVIPKA